MLSDRLVDTLLGMKMGGSSLVPPPYTISMQSPKLANL